MRLAIAEAKCALVRQRIASAATEEMLEPERRRAIQLWGTHLKWARHEVACVALVEYGRWCGHASSIGMQTLRRAETEIHELIASSASAEAEGGRTSYTVEVGLISVLGEVWATTAAPQRLHHRPRPPRSGCTTDHGRPAAAPPQTTAAPQRLHRSRRLAARHGSADQLQSRALTDCRRTEPADGLSGGVARHRSSVRRSTAIRGALPRRSVTTATACCWRSTIRPPPASSRPSCRITGRMTSCGITRRMPSPIWPMGSSRRCLARRPLLRPQRREKPLARTTLCGARLVSRRRRARLVSRRAPCACALCVRVHTPRVGVHTPRVRVHTPRARAHRYGAAAQAH